MSDHTWLYRTPESIKHWPYRTASVTKRLMHLPLGDQMRDLKELLTRAVGVQSDNHVVYGLTAEDGSMLYLMFHDLSVIIGLGVEERNW